MTLLSGASYLLVIIWAYMFYHFFKVLVLSYRAGHVVNQHFANKGKPLDFPYLPTSEHEIRLYTQDAQALHLADKISHHKKRALIAFLIAFVTLMSITVHTMINGECYKTHNGFRCTTAATDTKTLNEK